MERIHHSDVIGSLLRPRYLSQAGEAYAAGQLTPPEFKRIEDRAVDEAIELQEGIGLDVVTDGEYRRLSFPDQIASGRQPTVEEFAYARARASTQIKITLPSPLSLAGGAATVRAEATRLAELGCTYIQIDAPDLLAGRTTLAEGLDIVDSVGDVPGVRFGVHVCQEGDSGQRIEAGGYDLVAEAMFSRLTNFDVFLLDYDDEGAASFEPLAKASDDKQIILGLVSGRTPRLESAAELTERIHQAARYAGLERLGLSTRCGFSSTGPGAGLISEDVQEAKLELIAQVAASVW